MPTSTTTRVMVTQAAMGSGIHARAESPAVIALTYPVKGSIPGGRMLKCSKDREVESEAAAAAAAAAAVLRAEGNMGNGG
eukprot:CAMPEP_0175065292 /NCGR_PEP_ID=MMETSP0052_2-20121109/15837_1 /TAXON_ID=51329 ORGANISM="Polytomella parva, Strain SAG 63-3" /NCGR_SAMPLE_ID=MMETSP0052_2 /ASSEMBLY_ACC=CAM_ASM_000194 /LENGTH=79 /DNA_ID=CAMNT_0016331797 /DNA_START=63 /DNA_END=298 /DNA_ORIENTATION=-